MKVDKSVLYAAVRRYMVISLCVLPVLGRAAEPEQGAEPHDDHEHAYAHEALEEVVVTATPLAGNLEGMSQSASVIRGAELNRQLSNNLGETLARMPGMANASFGENVGRPVIRGFEGARVGVLSNNMSASDASAVSQDHAVSVEPFMADQIEVLRGPATLLYGSGSIGGVVNIVTNTIPGEVPEDGVEGRAMLQADSAANQRFGAARLDAGGGALAFHANAFDRKTRDYEIPGDAELSSAVEHEAESLTGVLENSFLENRGGALGASWIGDQWRFGASMTRYDSNYGIPGAHGHEEGHDDEHADAQEANGGEEALVTIGLESDRYDFELEGQSPFPYVDALKVLVSDTSYEHTEFEGTEVGTFFASDTLDGRIELNHRPWSAWAGVFGLQWTDRDFVAIGEEAFVPPSTSQTLAAFWLEQAEFDTWQLEFGARFEKVEIEAEPHAGLTASQRLSFSPFSASAGAIWHLDEGSHLSFRLASAARAPSDQELFAHGPHAATQTFEVGDPALDIERNRHLEVGYRLHEGSVTVSLSAFFDAFSEYIFERDTGLVEDGLPVRAWSQQDADFFGGEAELRLDLGEYSHGHWQLFAFGDLVRAEFDDGSNVPRIPPVRIGAGIEWHRSAWAATLNWTHASRQGRVADFETPTPGYDLVNVDLSYRLPVFERSDWELFGKAHNLLDEDVRNHTSFLKDQAPQIGRNFVLGLRSLF